MSTTLGQWLKHAKTVRLPSCFVRPQRKFILVTGNESCDLDSASCAITTAFFSSVLTQHVSIYIPLLPIQRADLSLRPELIHMFKRTGIDPNDVCTLEDISAVDPSRTGLFLVDHNVPRGTVDEMFDFPHHPERKELVEGIIDHHDPEDMFSQIAPRMKRYDIQKSGSCASLVANWIMGKSSAYEFSPSVENGDRIFENEKGANGEIAQLLLSAVLIDTANLTVKVTPNDPPAVDFLSRFVPDLDLQKFYSEIQAVKSSIEGMSLEDLLRRDYKEYDTSLGKLGISLVLRDISYLRDNFPLFEKEVHAYGKDRKLKVHIVMTVSGQGKKFHRGGLIITDDSKVMQALREQGEEKYGFKDAEVFGVFADTEEGLLGWVYVQNDLTASRKQIAPMAREIMGNKA